MTACLRHTGMGQAEPQQRLPPPCEMARLRCQHPRDCSHRRAVHHQAARCPIKGCGHQGSCRRYSARQGRRGGCECKGTGRYELLHILLPLFAACMPVAPVCHMCAGDFSCPSPLCVLAKTLLEHARIDNGCMHRHVHLAVHLENFVPALTCFCALH